MNQQRRLLIAIGLSFGLLTAWNLLYEKPRLEAEQARQAQLAAASDAGPSQVVMTFDADGGAHVAAAAQLMNDDAGLTATALPLRTVNLERPTMKMSFTSEGAGLETAELLGSRERVQRELTIVEGYKKLFGAEFAPGPQMDMADPSPGAPPQLGVTLSGATPINGRLRYAVTEEQPGRVTFTGRDGPWEITKVFTWNSDAQGLAAKAKLKDRDPTGYELQLDVSLKNTSAQTAGGLLAVHLNRGIDPALETGPSMFGGIGNESLTDCVIADTLHSKKPDNEKPVEEERGLVQFVALDQQYFVSAVWPKDGAVDGLCVMHASSTLRQAELAQAITVGAGETVTKRFGSFLGPKDLELLNQVGVGDAFRPNLDKTVDFGWWAVICRGLLFFLHFFHGLLGNWGLSIILLTVMVKVVLLPLTHRAMASGEKMREVQLRLKPALDEINAKYASSAA